MKLSRIVVCVAAVIAANEHRRRQAKLVPRKHLDWEAHRDRLVQERQFKRYYRMGVVAFKELVESLKPMVERDDVKSRNRTDIGPITPVNKVLMTISWLTGGSFHSIRALAGVSKSEFYSSVVAVMEAICAHPRYKITALSTIMNRYCVQHRRDNILTGCVGCGDEWLCKIKALSAKDVPDVLAFFPGHYLCHGINGQAMCDAAGYCFNSPGKVADSVALKKWPLSTAIAKLPFRYYIIGDNAYTLHSTPLAPFKKPEIKSSGCSDYNFYLSQLRIRMKMGFGLLVNQWQVFKRPLAVDVMHVGLIIKTGMKLHSYCIDERIQDPASGGFACAAVREYNAMDDCSFFPTAEESLAEAI